MEVAAADAAQIDGDEHVVGADVGDGDLLDLEAPGALEHGRGHGVRHVPHGRAP